MRGYGRLTKVSPNRHSTEIANLAEVEEAVSYCVEHKRALRIDLVLHLHKLLMKNVPERPKHPIKPGQLRGYTDKMEAEGVRYLTKHMPSAMMVRTKLIDLLEAVEDGRLADNHILAAAKFHYRFVRIHPFCDRNGRMARALSTLLVARRSPDVLSLEVPINKVLRDHREDYVGVLEYSDGIYEDLNDTDLSEEAKLEWCEAPFEYFYARVVMTSFIEEWRRANEAIRENQEIIISMKPEAATEAIRPPPPLPDLSLEGLKAEFP